MINTFSVKTIGFIEKPFSQEMIWNVLKSVIRELNEDLLMRIEDFRGKLIEIRMDDIVYLKASGSCTELFTKDTIVDPNNKIVLGKKLGRIEAEIHPSTIIRVHKSYIINLAHVIGFEEKILLTPSKIQIPLGRTYKKDVRNKYLQYVRYRVKIRI